MISILLFIFSAASPYAVRAQETRILAEHAKNSTSATPVVLIKWYSAELVYDEGVNLYRKKEGTLAWEKINELPIRKKQTISPSLLSTDPDMDVFADIILKASKKELQEDMLLFNILIKSFQSNAFAEFMGIYYEDRTVQSGVAYEYKVNKIISGKESVLGVSQPITAGDYAPASPIESVEVFQKGKTLNINWKHEEERFYAVNIYRQSNTDAVPAKLNIHPIVLSQARDSLGNLAYPKPMFSEDRKLEEGKSYTYQLAGVGFFGNETQWSEPVNVAFEDVTPPPAPKNLDGRADSMKVNLHWENVPVEDLSGLNVNRSMKSDGPYEVINTTRLGIETVSFFDSLTVPGPYYYFISAVDSSGNEAHSNLIFVEVQDVFPPAQPQEVTMKADTGRVMLSWKMGAEPDLGGYYIYRTVDKNDRKNYILLNAIPLKDDHFQQPLPKNVRNEFFYYVVAVDTSYNRSPPSVHVSGVMPDVLAPEKPFIKNISYQEDHIVVEWMPNVDADLAGYHIYRADTSKDFTRVNINMLGRENFRYTDRNNTENTDYFYYLTALDSAGNASPASKEVYARRVVKRAPQAGKFDLKIKHRNRRKDNQLQWEYNDDDTAVMGYVVFRGEQENRLQPITGLIKSKSFTDRKIDNGDKHEKYYQVRAYLGSEVIYSPIIKQKL